MMLMDNNDDNDDNTIDDGWIKIDFQFINKK